MYAYAGFISFAIIFSYRNIKMIKILSKAKQLLAFSLMVLTSTVTCQFYTLDSIKNFSVDCFESIKDNLRPSEVFLLSNPEDGDNG